MNSLETKVRQLSSETWPALPLRLTILYPFTQPDQAQIEAPVVCPSKKTKFNASFFSRLGENMACKSLFCGTSSSILSGI